MKAPATPDKIVEAAKPYIERFGFLGLKYIGMENNAQIWLLRPPKNKMVGAPIIFKYINDVVEQISGLQAARFLSVM